MNRLATAIPMLLVVTFLVFAFIDLAPGDAAKFIAGPEASPERLDEVRRQLGLNQPLLLRFFSWLEGVATGDFGVSLLSQAPVLQMIGDRLPVTLSLVAVTVVISVFVGLMVGMLAGRCTGTLLDRIISGVFSAAIAVPAFWAALVLASVLAVKLRIFPAIGYVPLTEDLFGWLHHLVLPAVALAMLPVAEIGLQFRASLSDVLSKDFVMNAEAKGMSPATVLFKHASKNAMIPVVTVLGYRFAQILGGTVVIENVFNLPGIGTLALTSVLGRDIPVMLGLVALTTLMVILVNLFVDISYGYFNPKVRSKMSVS